MKHIGKYLLTSSLAIVPYYIIVILYSTNYKPFRFALSEATRFMAYVFSIPLQITMPFALFSVLGLLFVSRKNKLTLFCLIWFLVWFLVFSHMEWIGTRITEPLMPALAILSSVFVMTYFGKIFSKLGFRKQRINSIQNLLIVILLTYLVLESLYVFTGTYDDRNILNLPFYDKTILGGHAVNNNKFPYEETALFLKPKLERDEALVLIKPSKNALFEMEDIMKFYMENTDGVLTRTVHPFYFNFSELHSFCNKKCKIHNNTKPGTRTL